MAKKIAVLQIDSVLGNTEENLSKIDKMIESIQDKDVRMAVFCEYGTTGYCTDLLKIADPVPGYTSEGLVRIAKKHNIWISGGTAENVDGKIANTSLMISPEKGLVAKYRKIHPFGDEKNSIVYGDKPVVIDTEIGKVGMTICYDFIFPELVRGLALKGAEIILNSTFWFADDISGPAGWGPEQALSLARIRALENNVYVAMACRTGEELAPWGGKVRGFGYSSIAGPVGNTIVSACLGEMVITAEIDLDKRKSWAEYAAYLKDRRPEIYKEILDL